RTKRDEHVTFCLLRYWFDGRIVFAGGHEDIFVRRASGAFDTLEPLGAWLGAKRDISRVTTDTAAELRPGDVLLLYTDGITEAKSAAGQLLGTENLRRIFDGLCAASVGAVAVRKGLFDAAR